MSKIEEFRNSKIQEILTNCVFTQEEKISRIKAINIMCNLAHGVGMFFPEILDLVDFESEQETTH